MKTKESCKVISQECIATGVYSMWLETEAIAKDALPGQFVSVYSNDASRLLPRPISLCEVDKEKGAIRIVYRIAGKGTEEFSHLKAGDAAEVLGPLGNGFPLDQVKGKKVLLMGGGIGIPPMLEAAKQLAAECTIISGYRDEVFLKKELKDSGQLYIATEDGSQGTKGNVLDAVRANGLSGDVIFACGPTPMLRAVKAYAKEQQIECWISMEEKMACGVGACLACVCRSNEVDSHSNVNNKRICKDGPVFLASEVTLS